MSEYRKAIVAGLALILANLNDYLADDVLDLSEQQSLTVTVVTLAVGIWGVWRVPNGDANENQ